jgi:molecular chaperone HtpG
MNQETFTFRTEVERLLEIVAHSLYSHKEIFLRELISNASDACDRLRYAALTDDALTAGDADLKIRIRIDREARTLSVEDNGIGMERDELVETLGTIARSGTQAFVSQLTGEASHDLSLIGQFGVGFYSAFMVADRVDVLTRKASTERAWQWSSDGRGTFTIDEAERAGRGTTVIVHLKADQDEFLEVQRLRTVVKTYSDHIAFPILLGDGDGAERVNAGSALWTRAKKDITDAQYKEFYRHVGHSFDDPWLTMHNTVEGVVSYTSLLFVPEHAPFDLFDPQRKSRVKLFVKKVFITDDCEALVPAYLRFLRGVVDTEDLPLNISRESFQHDPRLARIRSGLVKRVFDALAKKASAEDGGYGTFWESFGPVLKEGLYEDFEHRERILELSRFRTTHSDGLTSLDGYVSRMKPEQQAIYTLSGEDVPSLLRSPQLEGFRAKGVEVLLMTDPIDEFWVPSVRTYQDKPFKSVAAADADLDAIAGGDAKDEEGEDANSEAAMGELVAALKLELDQAVKDVRLSKRLIDSAVCLVAAEGEMDMHLERLLRRHQHGGAAAPSPRVLEINPAHPLIRQLAGLASAGEEGAAATLRDAAFLLLDQARIVEGEPVGDPVTFSQRMLGFMQKGLGSGRTSPPA